ncbi:MAG: hypothetical protein KDD84_10595 [Caldilineaceae bacterium]|nr:hypothetical protein [Caldilineaceae bacterium]
MVRRTRTPRIALYLFFVIVALGVALRALRLDWQPLWWDEGYSVYFATEPLLAMLRLTAEDIHPPLYYALLHGWLLAWGNATPLTLRTFSILIGVLALPAFWWTARVLFPRRPGLAVWATLLLAISPMHIFYSQEVRMYGLELLLGLLSTGFFWRMMAQSPADSPAESATRRTWTRSRVLYALTTTALLYTEYYAVLLPAAHLLWGVWSVRRDGGQLRRLLWTGVAVAVLYLPWLVYATPALLNYIPGKVVADADDPLSLPIYLWRHLSAFLTGHVTPVSVDLARLQFGAVVAGALLLLIAASFAVRRRRKTTPSAPHLSPFAFLSSILLLAFTVGFLLNLRLPFFPEGGERVLFFVLPYFLLAIAAVVGDLVGVSLWRRAVQTLTGAVVVLCAGLGIYTFLSTPRYADNDYRALIHQIVQQGRPEDTVFAVFPWQMGYWRAYAPVWGRSVTDGPNAVLSPRPSWGEPVAQALDDALDDGAVWFPAHLALGAFLEREVDEHLSAQSVQFESRWYSTTTQLSGWRRVDVSQMAAISTEINFGPVRLGRQSGVDTSPVRSANDVTPVSLVFEPMAAETLPLVIALRLLDDADRVWAGRDIQVNEGDPLAQGQPQIMGLLTPVGLPPGQYRIAVGVRPADALQLLLVDTVNGPRDLAPIGVVQVLEPETAQSALRLPIRQRLAAPVHRDGIDFLGFSGYDPDVPTVAGTELNLSLFLHKQALNLPPYQLYVGLLNQQGEGVAGWEGWPLDDYPTSIWPEDALVRVPVAFYLPAALNPDDYVLVAGVIDPTGGQRSAPVQLGSLPVSRRQIRVDVPTPQHSLTPPVQVGTHARLIGYDMADADGVLSVILYWEILQTLLPPHQVFFHLTAADGTILAQDDGVPGYRAVSAPSGTWLPGEIIVDPHEVPYAGEGEVTIRTGLYVPSTGVRLPIVIDEQIVGDAIELPTH